MNQRLDIDTWARKEHFHFFKQFEEPFFGVTVAMDCSQAYATAKKNNLSFFLYYLHCSLAAANAILPFRYRIDEQGVMIYDAVHASPTINRPDGSFGFAYMDYCPSLNKFISEAKREIDRVQNSHDLISSKAAENVIHYSSLPWINFTSLSHARRFSFNDSCPKISFGKMTGENGKLTLPVSIHVHHGLMDGYHVGQFIDDFQERMNKQL